MRISIGSLVIVVVLLLAGFYAWQYFGVRAQVQDVSYAKSRIQAGLNENYYQDVRSLEQQLRDEKSPEARRKIITEWNQRTGEHRTEQEMLENPSAKKQIQTVSGMQSGNLLDPYVKLLDDNTYEIQLDARRNFDNWYPTEGKTMPISGPAVISIKADGLVYSGATHPAVDPPSEPNGIFGLAKFSKTNPEQYPVGDAFFYALLMKVDDQPGFQIGDGTNHPVQIGPGEHTIAFMANLRLPELKYASGGFHLILKVEELQ